MSFSNRVVDLVLQIPAGRVSTYGQIACTAGGGKMASRSISSILSKYPNQKAIPWHRIVYAGGKVWLTPECEAIRRELYELEGIMINQNGMITNFEEVVFDFTELG